MHRTTPIFEGHAQQAFVDLSLIVCVTVVFMSRDCVAGHAKLTAVQQDAILQPGEGVLEREKSNCNSTSKGARARNELRDAYVQAGLHITQFFLGTGSVCKRCSTVCRL